MKYLILILIFCLNTAWAGIEELIIAQSVAAGNDVTVTYTPPTGKEVRMVKFQGNAAEDANTAVLLLWDYNQAGETVIWSTHGSVSESVRIVVGTGDGTKQVGLCLKNDDSVARVLSGKVILEIR